MATNALHAITEDAGMSRSTRFMQRLNARKGIFDRDLQPQPELAHVPPVAEMPVREAGNHPAEDGSESFLQLYMKAFTAARK